MSRLTVLVAVSLTALAAAPSLSAAAPPPRNQHIVVLKAGVGAAQVARDHRDRHKVVVAHVYGRALNGYAARITSARLDALRSDRRVAYVERDAEIRASETQANATWGLDRVDQRALPLRCGPEGLRAYVPDAERSAAKRGGR